MIEVTISGLDDLMATLKGSTERIQKKALREGLKEGGRIIRDAARRKVPVDTGLLRRSLKMVTLRQRKGYPVAILVGYTASAATKLLEEGKKTGKKPFYWIFQHFGWTDREGKRHQGTMFLTQALLENKGRIEEAVGSRIKKVIAEMGTR